MRTTKNRFAFYSVIALVVISASLSGGWLINSAIKGQQYAEVKKPQKSTQQTLIDEHFSNALSYMQDKKYPQAVYVWNQLLLINDSIPEVHVNQGFSLFEMGHIKPASEHFQHALDLNSYQVNAYYGLAICLEKMQDMEAAMGAMRSYIHLADDNDPFIRRARSALWEWESRINTAEIADKTSPDNSAISDNQ